MAERILSASKSNLPAASAVIEDGDMFREAVRLLKALSANAVRMSELKERDEELRTALAAICTTYGLDHGFKYGMSGFEYHGYLTRQTLNKELLLANGVDAATIAASFKTGEPFLSCKLVTFDVE